MDWQLRMHSWPMQSMVDLAGLFRVWNPRFKSWSVWSQVRHTWLAVDAHLLLPPC